jgi:hypothetical protein
MMADSENDALVELEELELPLLAQLTDSPEKVLLTEPVTVNPTGPETSVGEPVTTSTGSPSKPSKGDVVNSEQHGTREGFDEDITSCVDVTSSLHESPLRSSQFQSQPAAVVIGDCLDTVKSKLPA